MVDHHSALIYTMVLLSASDGNMSDDELNTIGENVRYLPIFKDFDFRRLPEMTEECLKLLSDAPPQHLKCSLCLPSRALLAAERPNARMIRAASRESVVGAGPAESRGLGTRARNLRTIK